MTSNQVDMNPKSYPDEGVLGAHREGVEAVALEIPEVQDAVRLIWARAIEDEAMWWAVHV